MFHQPENLREVRILLAVLLQVEHTLQRVEMLAHEAHGALGLAIGHRVKNLRMLIEVANSLSSLPLVGEHHERRAREQLIEELGEYGIRANAVAPGAVATPLLLNGRLKDPDMRAAALRAIPMNRLAAPIELARAILFLASSEASYITGQILVVDGGATIP